MGCITSKEKAYNKNVSTTPNKFCSKKKEQSIVHCASKDKARQDDDQSLEHAKRNTISHSNEKDIVELSNRYSQNNLSNFTGTPVARKPQRLLPDTPGPNKNSPKKILKALYDYKPRQPDELGFKKNDRLQFLSEGKEENGWWTAKHIFTGECGYIPSNYVVKDNKDPESQEWWFDVDRRQSDKLLALPQNPNGTFLVRATSDKTSYALSVAMVNKKKVNDAGVKHYRIRVMDDKKRCFINPRRCFDSVVELIEHYKARKDGLCCRLTRPCPREPIAVPFKEIEVERSAIEIQTKLGAGMFGEVWKGKWKNVIEVAVKTLKPGTMSAEAFLEEAKFMHQLRHPKLVQLMGVCTAEEPMYIITELMEHGALLHYLRSEKRFIQFTDIVDMAAQIASGMSYLEAKSFIHRDVRAANMLVGLNTTVKVADFGLARVVEDNEYTAHVETKFPIKWTAPEAAFSRQFSTKSDVWSFGVLLYEMITYGGDPYPDMRGQEALRRVEQGYRMPQPTEQECPDSFYEMMLKCWDSEAVNRPTFAFLYDFFGDYFVATEKCYTENIC